MMEVISATIDVAYVAVKEVGLPVLVVIFLLKGALIGKIFPTSVFLPGYVLAVGATASEAAFVVVLVTAAHIVGQFVIYGGSRRYGHSFLSWLPFVDLTPESPALVRVEQWFDRYGGIAVFVTNVVPWSRGLIAIPAGVGQYPFGRYTLHVTTATIIYHSVYVAVPLAGLAAIA